MMPPRSKLRRKLQRTARRRGYDRRQAGWYIASVMEQLGAGRPKGRQ